MESTLHILIANEPSTYRQVLATELPFLRPQYRILSVDPADLDTAVAQFYPLMVICSRMSEALRDHAVATIVLYPDGDDRAVIEAGGQLRLLSSPRLADLLAAVDAIAGASPTRA